VSATAPPRVELVGAGPGDPDLLTLRAEAALAAATVVVCDRVVARLARTFAPDAIVTVSAAGGPDAGSIDRGATVDGDAVALLTGAARRGERVVRLYRGDPWLHPAYAVESAILAGAGLEIVVVPGLAVELAVPATAGIAVHSRPVAATVTVAAPAGLPPAVDPARTLVAAVDDAGWALERVARTGDPALPAAVLSTGSRPPTPGVAPRVITGTLGGLAGAGVTGTGVLVVGAVAAGVTASSTTGASSATVAPLAAADPEPEPAQEAVGD
jgi:siroheme synthase